MKDHLSSDNIHTIIGSFKGLREHGDKLFDAKNFNRSHHDAIMEAAAKSDDYPTKLIGKKLIKQSKFATMEDAKRRPGSQMYFDLLDNPHLAESEHKKLKDEFIANATGGNPDSKPARWSSGSFGFDGMVTIPESLSKHMTNDDYSKLAEHNYRLEFDNKHHSNKFLDVSLEHAKKLDKKISDLKESGYAITEPEVRDAKLKLKNHMQNYAQNIDNHIGRHVVHEDNILNVADWGEHEKTAHRLTGGDNSFDSLKHYATPSNKVGEHDHYDEHFGDLKSTIDRVATYLV